MRSPPRPRRQSHPTRRPTRTDAAGATHHGRSTRHIQATRHALCIALLGVLAQPAFAQTSDNTAAGQASASAATNLDRITVVGRRLNLVGEAISASEGSVSQDEISARPMQRTGDLLEFVPGLVATQHSGSGKANQYFLRGFNLDHGTDFATYVDGMPVNMRTHGHGQGYTDLNFLIPEAVGELDYRKGTYYADVGDFSSAGSARFHLADRVDTGLAELTVGEYGYQRGVLLDSIDTGSNNASFLYGIELQHNDGPWSDIDEDVRKANAILKYSTDVAGGRGAITMLGYRNSWNSPDQIPQRAVDQGLIDAFGSIDTTVGGESSRYSLSADWTGPAYGGEFAASAYAIRSDLDLYSNFTYLLEDPVDGDQFRQVDERTLYGFSLSQQWDRGRSRWRVGAEGRYDDIGRVGLFRTVARQPLSTVRDDSVEEGSLGLFVANEFRFNDQWRTYVGVRHDRYAFDVDSSLPANSGSADDSATSAKASVAWRPSALFEGYLSYGQGFHSNDARGTTITVDPVSGDPVDKVDPLVHSTGVELGTRFYFSERLHATAALWRLDLDSELLFVGDAGTTEGSRPSRRDGIELGMYWFGSRWFEGNLEASYTRSGFRDDDPAGDSIPGSIPLVVSAGVTGRNDANWYGSLQLRHFGAYPLIEDDSVESAGSTLVNLRIGKDWDHFGLALDLLNLFDSRDHDIDYYYASRLAGERLDGVDDIHFHVFEPRSARLTLRWRF